MDPRLLHHYSQELQHLRETGAEFAAQFPKIAARLGMDGIEVSDPYVERLLEGCAFLTARVQIRLDAEFPRFTQRLLEMVYPSYLAPTPSMLIARFQPDLQDDKLARGVVIPRDSALQGLLGKGDASACEFRTAQELTLWPLELESARYFSFAPDLPLNSLPGGRRIKGGVRLRLHATAGLKFSQFAPERLRLHLCGGDEVAYKLHELIHGALVGALVGPAAGRAYDFLPPARVRAAGFEDDEALLPVTLRGFRGYRLLQEYFAFPQRFLFFDVDGLAAPLGRVDGDAAELVLLFDGAAPELESVVDAGNFALHCTPAINLFPRRCDRIHVDDGSSDYHVVPDRTRPMDFEVYSIAEVKGYGSGVDAERIFQPFYAAFHERENDRLAYYCIHREPRLLSAAQQRNGFRSSYVGSEVFLSLVDQQEAPVAADLRQLAVAALCTNRDLPLQMPLGLGKTDFTLNIAAPVEAVRCIKGPSKPHSSLRQGNVAWRFVDHLSLNYLSLTDNDERQGAAALRQMLDLYAGGEANPMGRQIEGLRSVQVRPTVRRFPAPGPVCFGRGLRIEMEVDELAFEGGSAFLFGSVMDQFLARYVSINAFTETVLRSSRRGEIMHGVPRCGERAIL